MMDWGQGRGWARRRPHSPCRQHRLPKAFKRPFAGQLTPSWPQREQRSERHGETRGAGRCSAPTRASGARRGRRGSGSSTGERGGIGEQCVHKREIGRQGERETGKERGCKKLREKRGWVTYAPERNEDVNALGAVAERDVHRIELGSGGLDLYT